MKIFESHFWYNKRQRNGILFLFIFLFAIELILTFVDFKNEEFPYDGEFALLQHKIDSLKRREIKKEKYTLKPFNPNYISDFKAYQLGLKTTEIDKLFAFRGAGNFINSATEFQKVTGIHDSLMVKISPYFKFPKWAAKRPKSTTTSKAHTKSSKVNDLNQATFDQLIQIEGVNPKMAGRILAYKKLLKGYSENDQLYEVYELDKKTVKGLLAAFQVRKKPIIEKININSATFKEILHTPYIDYELTKKICDYRQINTRFDKLEELKKIDSFPVKKFNRIALYLYAE